jgi:DNA-binding CsgD family transcriptional regulator
VTPADPVRLIEAAYGHVPMEHEWLASVLEASGAYDVGSGVVAFTATLGERPRIRSICATPAAAGAARQIEAFLDTLPPRLAPAVLAPSEFVGNGSWRVNRILSTLHGERATGPKPNQLPPMWGLLAGDGATEALVVAFPTTSEKFAADLAFPHRDRRTLGLVGAHISSALRLRRSLAGAASADVDAGAEAILSPAGRLMHADGLGKSRRARQSLSEAVVRAERARGRLRRTSCDEATRLWQALVGGRWSIVEVVERDGKRLLVARANGPTFPHRASLTKEENDVVWLVALGHSYKYVGYELGLGPSTVVRRLTSALLELGIASRVELLRKLGR